METLAGLTAAPLALDVGGQRYEMSPLTLKDLGQLKRRIRGYIAHEAKEAAEMMVGAGAPPEDIAELWREAREAMKNPLSPEWLGEPEPLHEFILLSLRHQRPDITPETVEQLLSNEKVLDQFTRAAQELNATDAEAEADSKNP